MKRTESMGAALLTDLDLRPLRCLVCGCPTDGNTLRVTQAEDGRRPAICDDCCGFSGEVPHDFRGGGQPSASPTPARTP